MKEIKLSILVKRVNERHGKARKAVEYQNRYGAIVNIYTHSFNILSHNHYQECYLISDFEVKAS